VLPQRAEIFSTNVTSKRALALEEQARALARKYKNKSGLGEYPVPFEYSLEINTWKRLCSVSFALSSKYTLHKSLMQFPLAHASVRMGIPRGGKYA